MPRKYYRKKKKTLSKSQIFSKKSAKSQAKQIYALNKKVNYLQKINAPEIQIFKCNLLNKLSGNQNDIKTCRGWIAPFSNFMFNNTVEGYHALEGNMLRVRNMIFYGSIGFDNDATLYPQGTVFEDNTEISQAAPRCAYLRLVFCQLRKGGAAALPVDITQNLNPTPDTGVYTDLSLINGPLIDNIAETYRILGQKIIKIDINKPQKMFKYVLKRPFIIHNNNFARTNNTDPFKSGEIIVYWRYVCPQIIQITDGQDINRIGPTAHFSLSCKIAYCDQN